MASIYSDYSVNKGFGISGIGFRNLPVYSPKITPAQDGYASNPIYENFGNKTEIELSAKKNPRIKEIMNEYNLPIKVNEKELAALTDKNGHLQRTRITAAGIYSNLPQEMKSKLNPQVLQEAALLHDYGKVLIPENIVHKTGSFTDSEWEIMQQHSEIGYELLKNKNLNPRTLELIKYHHQTPSLKGYPIVRDGYEYGLDSEILSVADKYEALREKRSYKDAMSKEDALNIIYEDVQSGAVSQEVFDALKKSVL